MNECCSNGECNVMVNSEEFVVDHRISDAIDKVLHKPMSL